MALNIHTIIIPGSKVKPMGYMILPGPTVAPETGPGTPPPTPAMGIPGATVALVVISSTISIAISAIAEAILPHEASASLGIFGPANSRLRPFNSCFKILISFRSHQVP